MKDLALIVAWIVSNLKDLIGTAIILGIVGIPTALLLYARHLTVSAHREQFKATGGAEFPLPSERRFEAPEDFLPASAREASDAPTEIFEAVGSATGTQPHVILNTDTGEMVRLDADGLPMSEADLSARTPSTSLTVDPVRLAEILQMEDTREYKLNTATFIEVDAAEVFMRNPLTSPVLPPEPLIAEAGNPALADTFWALVNQGGLRSDWKETDSDFHFWDVETPLADTFELDETFDYAGLVGTVA
jgi:hypothetical protein